jgi:bifunctional non-homologous end joining protein LigD
MPARTSLNEYRRKRQFNETPEPSGGRKSGRRGQTRFVVQKHDATNLHYDFRLEIDGVLASWAVPKGPSLNPGDKRLAMATEDHPLEYRDFEGVIPEGHYGAGTVMVWDQGTYDSEDGTPAREQLARGEIKVVLHGEKLRGGFVLVRMGAKRWLLIKHKDDFADRKWDSGRPELGRSVLSGRTLEEIAEGHSVKKHARRARG